MSITHRYCSMDPHQEFTGDSHAKAQECSSDRHQDKYFSSECDFAN